MPLSQDGTIDADVIANLYIEALRKGQPLWFRVLSGSMHPVLRIGEQVRIESATAEQIRVGEIAAFETAEGLVIHRIVRQQHEGTALQLVEMSDVHFRSGLVDEGAVVGRVVAIRRGHTLIDLQHPIAQKCGRVTARLRYRLYGVHTRNKLTQVVVRKCSRLVARLGSWFIRSFCSSFYQESTTNAV